MGVKLAELEKKVRGQRMSVVASKTLKDFFKKLKAAIKSKSLGYDVNSVTLGVSINDNISDSNPFEFFAPEFFNQRKVRRLTGLAREVYAILAKAGLRPGFMYGAVSDCALDLKVDLVGIAI